MPNPRDDFSPPRRKRHRKPRPTAECWRCRKDIDLIDDGVEELGKTFHLYCYLKYKPREED